MDNHAIFKLSYGLFVLTTKSGEKVNGCIINTAQQVTAIPERISITVAKSNLTHDLVAESQQFCVSVLGEHAPLEVVQHFGMQSGRTIDKFKDLAYKEDVLGNPYLEEGMIAYLTGKVIQQVDLGTHTMFIADYVDAKVLGEEAPLTYAGYRERKNGAQKQTSEKAVYECSICHYEYDGEEPFDTLPEDYICPICKQPKKVFIKK